jgi:AraC-like DNA-binding protein
MREVIRTCASEIKLVQAGAADVHSLHERALTWVSFKPIADVPCRIDFELRKFDDLGLLSGTVQGVRHEHARRDSGDGDDDFSFHLNVSGTSHLTGPRGETMLHAGDAMLLSYSVSRTISRPEPVDHRVIRLPRAALTSLMRNIDDAVLLRIPAGTGMLSLLKSYVDAIFYDPALSAADKRRIVVTHLCDLVAVTLGTARHPAFPAERRGVRAARLSAIKADIETHLARGDLSPATVSKRQQVSESYIRKLFGREGTSFSEYVLRRRLMRAHRMLTDGCWAGVGVASIAYDAGFRDLSYFNRAFKRTYGTTPSEVRNANLS